MFVIIIIIIFFFFLADIPVGVELSTNYWDQANQTTAHPCQWVNDNTLIINLY